ncbi:MAG TPA: ADYC domain-containing protein [Polyangia bacterium]|nr:ADYC domain-containing protein [Polyangia bacterium]
MRLKTRGDEQSSLLASVNLGGPWREGQEPGPLRIESGRLALVHRPPGSATSVRELVGSVLQGTAGDGTTQDIAICDTESDPTDPTMHWYRIEVWNDRTEEWENPCTPMAQIPSPRALAVAGVWDRSGAHRGAAGKFTFACETGTIVKCANWGYKPWQTRNGQSLEDVHQACTRMARADYCGDGRSHTTENTIIDHYDRAGINQRQTTAMGTWDPALAEFEAAWTPDGAYCLRRQRHENGVDAILKECPGRFRIESEDLGTGDVCAVRQAEGKPNQVLLRNRVIKLGGQGLAQSP